MSPLLKILGLMLLLIALVLAGFSFVLNIDLAPAEVLDAVPSFTPFAVDSDVYRFGMTQTREANILSGRVDKLAAVAGTPCATATQAQPISNLRLVEYIETHLAEKQIAYESVSALIYRGSPCILVIPEREEYQEVHIVLQVSDSNIDKMMIFETVIDSLATSWKIDMTFLRRVTIQFEGVIWQTNNFSQVRQTYLEGIGLEILYQQHLLE